MDTSDWSRTGREREGVPCHGHVGGRRFALRLPATVEPPSWTRPDPDFTGRDGELAAARAALAEPTAPPLTLTGPAGTGKTELARRLCHAPDTADHFPGGILATRLHGSSDRHRVEPARALDTLLRTLGLPPALIPADHGERAALLHTALAAYAAHGRRLLLLLDDATADQLRPLLPARGTAGVLVTARSATGHPGTAYPLDALPIGDASDLVRRILHRHAHPAAGAGTASAASTESAPVSVSMSAPVSDDPAARRLAEACRRLPSAVRLAATTAARTGRPLTETARELRPTTRGATGLASATSATGVTGVTGADTAGQHRDAVHRLALAGLTDRQARLVRLLDLNPGPDLSTEAAARLADTPDAATAADLDALHRAALVHRTGPAPRWSPAVPADPSETQEPEALGRLADHYLATARAACARLRPDTGPDGTGAGAFVFADRAQALAWLDAEHRNLMALLRRAPGPGRPATTAERATALAAAVDLATAIEPFLAHGHHLDDLVQAAETTLAVAREHGDRPAEMAALCRLGRARCAQGRYQDAMTAHHEAALEARRTRNWALAMTALTGLCPAWTGLGRYGVAVREGRRASAFARRLGDRQTEYTAVLHTGLALAARGSGPAAAKELGRARQLAEADGDQQRSAVALRHLGLVALDLLGRPTEAAAVLGIAFDAFRSLDDQHEHAVTLGLTARALHHGDASQDALEFFRDAAERLLDLGDELAGYGVLGEAAEALRTLDRPAQQVAALEPVAAFHTRSHDQAELSRTLTDLGAALTSLERREEAVDVLTRAVQAARDTDEASALGAALGSLGRALPAEQHREALAAHHESVTIARRNGDRAAEVRALVQLSSTLYALKRPAEGAAALRRSRAALRGMPRRGPTSRTAVHPA
ncbi:AAA family ATPase, partial [Kitasatospora sp. MBT63]|uniref:AAA family ATPase n=1 Tax=Kitasatospora sp. MBT63 TaxID=1444768 RepID=UPI00053A45FB